MLPILISAALLGSCPAERATYVMRHHPEITWSFQPIRKSEDWPSGLVAVVDDRSQRQRSWWLPWNGGTDSLQHINSVDGPIGADVLLPGAEELRTPFGIREYIGLDAGYNVIDHVPVLHEPAPAHILLPDADDQIFWKDMFDLTACRPAKAASAG